MKLEDIKLRFFDEEHKEMLCFTVEDLHIKGMTDPTSSLNKKIGNSNNIMRFTGLLDKNRKEIYEGDIIKTEYGYFDVFWDSPYAMFELNNSDNKPVSLDMNPNALEIVGNIYEETPEQKKEWGL